LGVVLIMSHLPGILMLQKGPKRVHKSLWGGPTSKPLCLVWWDT
jgi:hypothetical protein